VDDGAVDIGDVVAVAFGFSRRRARAKLRARRFRSLGRPRGVKGAVVRVRKGSQTSKQEKDALLESEEKTREGKSGIVLRLLEGGWFCFKAKTGLNRRRRKRLRNEATARLIIKLGEAQ
jgi:hypothetical protein